MCSRYAFVMMANFIKCKRLYIKFKFRSYLYTDIEMLKVSSTFFTILLIT